MMNGHDHLMNSGATFSRDATALRSKAADEIRECWQYKILFETKCAGRIGNVALVVIANLYYEAMDTLLRVVFPGFKQLQLPILTGYATIMPGGQVVCDKLVTPMLRVKNVLLYESEDELIGDFRKLADRLKLPDDEREGLFTALKKWVSQDRRVGPDNIEA